MTEQEKATIYRECKQVLSGHFRKTPQEILEELARLPEAKSPADFYGSGEVIAAFEKKIAHLLGKPAAVFMPSGTMAQQIALRIYSNRAGNPRVGFHQKSHLELHEHKGHELLHRLSGTYLGEAHRIVTAEDIRECKEPLSAVLYELPQREIGGHLPKWDELVAISRECRSRGFALHMDGARLWESQPAYAKPFDEICSLFDSVYVSFYKGIGAIAGAILAGPEDFIAESRIWLRRHGGNLFTLFPYVLSASHNFDARIGRMAAYVESAKRVAAEFKRIPGIQFTPDPPQTHMMHVYLPGNRERLEAEALEIARTEKIMIWRRLAPTSLPELSTFEFTAGDATLEFPIERIPQLFWRILKAGKTSS